MSKSEVVSYPFVFLRFFVRNLLLGLFIISGGLLHQLSLGSFVGLFYSLFYLPLTDELITVGFLFSFFFSFLEFDIGQVMTSFKEAYGVMLACLSFPFFLDPDQ